MNSRNSDKENKSFIICFRILKPQIPCSSSWLNNLHCLVVGVVGVVDVNTPGREEGCGTEVSPGNETRRWREKEHALRGATGRDETSHDRDLRRRNQSGPGYSCKRSRPLVSTFPLLSYTPPQRHTPDICLRSQRAIAKVHSVSKRKRHLCLFFTTSININGIYPGGGGGGGGQCFTLKRGYYIDTVHFGDNVEAHRL